ncbi:MAG: methyl-accepting chemotaxis protein [Clostridium sp.]|nr:methyl-accepting chemotaxis protein [Clostridium sp.]
MENKKSEVKVQKARNNEKEKSTFSFGIKGKLFVGFAILLICTILVGIVAYSLAASGMKSNYEDSMIKAMSTSMTYLDFGFDSAISESEQLYYNTDLTKWATGAIYNDWSKKEIEESVSLDLRVKRAGNNFVANMYIIPGENMPIISTFGNSEAVPGFYEELEDKEEKNCLQSLSGSWIGSHEYIDEVLGANYEGYSASSYACAYIRPMTTKRACIVIDYSSAAIADILQNLELGKGSISAFVTADGREILLKDDQVTTDTDFSFLTQSYYTQAKEDNAAMVIDYVTHKGKEYLFMISKSHKNGSAICAMVPVSAVKASADTIKYVTFFTLIASAIIAVFVCILVVGAITSTIKQINNKLKLVSGGDLTVTMNVHRNDEFRSLITHVVEMIRHSRDLVVQVLKTTENVSGSTVKLTEASEALTESNNQIATAMSEIDTGLNQQAQDAQNCLTLMEDLSQRIIRAVDTVHHMNSVTDNTKDIIAGGMTTMDDLRAKSTDTTNITKKVIDNIKNLENSLLEVEKFVDLINSIAEETSLLALNASIEAARAGDAGKGFAVVAQSVSKLSDGTIEAASQIQSVMEQIKSYTGETVNVAETAGEIVSKQTTTVNDTIKAFGGINDNLANLIKELASLESNIESMERHRNDTLSAIESISAVSEENTSSVSMVDDSLKHQNTMVDDLHRATTELEVRAKELEQAVNAFKIS